MEPEKMGKSAIRAALAEARDEIKELGGLSAFRSGDWLFALICKSFRNYSERATAEYISAKYPESSRQKRAEKLIEIAAGNAALAGGLTGAAVSLDELVALFTAGEGGLGIPVNVAVGLTAVAAEVLFITKIQLHLIARLGTLFEVPLDPDDPEDILTILSFAFGGGVAELAGKGGMKIGKQLAATTVKRYIRKELLQTLKRIARKLGYKLLQRTIINAAAPGASILIGTYWNKKTTNKIGAIAIRHFEERRVSMTANASRGMKGSPTSSPDFKRVQESETAENSRQNEEMVVEEQIP